MNYRINELAKLSGVTTRTLRYYDSIGLLKPERADESGYRIYGREQVDMLQQILFYRELGMELSEIKKAIQAPGFDRKTALENHLSALIHKKERIEEIILNVENTICSIGGEKTMTDKEKFEGFKKRLIEENERKYGEEVAERFGRESYESSKEKVAGMSEKQWGEQEEINREMFACLEAAMKKGDPACSEAQKAAELHKEWISMFWKEGTYSKEAHLALAEGYVADQRFRDYYDKTLGEGTAQFLRDAIAVYVK